MPFTLKNLKDDGVVASVSAFADHSGLEEADISPGEISEGEVFATTRGS